MAQNPSYGEYRNARRQAERRITALKSLAKESSGPVREGYQKEIRTLQSAIRATRATTKSGKRIKSHTEEYRAAKLRTLQEMNVNAEIYVRGGARTRCINSMMQSELNRASTGSFSMYSRDLARTFYRKGQKYWQNAPEGKNRNIAIVEGLRRELRQKGDDTQIRTIEDAYNYLVGKNEQKLVEAFRVLREARENPEAFEQWQIDEAWETVNDVSEGLVSPDDSLVKSSKSQTSDPVRARQKPSRKRRRKK